MTIDFWGLGLQAINVLILIWLLSRVFWRPLVAAIAARQKAAQAVIETAMATQDKADKALAEATQARAGMAAERSATLEKASQDAASASKATLAEAHTKAEAILAAAKVTISRDAEAARKENEAQAADLSLKIAARLLAQMSTPTVQSAFLAQLLDAIKGMPVDDRDALVADPKGVEIVTATDTSKEQTKIKTAVHKALGGTPVIHFKTDPDLIAGFELRCPHFVLHNSWQADLTQIRKAVNDAA